MGTPDNDTQNAPSFADRVNEAVANMKQGEDGKWQLPETVDTNDEALVFAINSERRRRDTQGAFTRVSQDKSRLEAEVNHLSAGWKKDFVSTLPVDKQAELEELKLTDPDKWREELSNLERAREEQFNSNITEIRSKAVGESEKDYRQRAFKEFTEANPELQLTDEVIKYDIPPRITMQLDKGEISFSEYLNKCAEYMRKGRAINKGDKVDSNIDLGKAAGSDRPSDEAERQQNLRTYEDEIY